MSDAPMRAHELLLTEAAPIAAENPELAAAMLSDAARAALWAGQTQLAAAVSSEARELALRAAEPIPASTYAFGLMFETSANDRADTLERAVADISVDPGDPVELHANAVILLWLEEFVTARQLLELAVRRARSSAHHPVLPLVLDTLACLDFRTGAWVAADGRSAEALRLAREAGQTAQA